MCLLELLSKSNPGRLVYVRSTVYSSCIFIEYYCLIWRSHSSIEKYRKFFIDVIAYTLDAEPVSSTALNVSWSVQEFSQSPDLSSSVIIGVFRKKHFLGSIKAMKNWQNCFKELCNVSVNIYKVGKSGHSCGKVRKTVNLNNCNLKIYLRNILTWSETFLSLSFFWEAILFGNSSCTYKPMVQKTFEKNLIFYL